MSKNRRAVDLQLLHRMQVVGVRLDLDEFEAPLIIVQDKEPGYNTIASSYLTSTYMGTAITVLIKIVGNFTVPLTFTGCSLSLPWTDTPVTLLPDPTSTDAPQIYRFSKYDATQFDRSQMIPQSGTLRRGQFIEGLLLGTHGDPINGTYANNADVPAVLRIADQFERIHSKEMFLKVDRMAEWRTKPQPVRPSRRRLFDQRDFHFQKSGLED